MAELTWTGTYGDWSDPSNWTDGDVPTSQDTVTFVSGSTVTITGAGYFGAMDLNGASITLAGDFGSPSAEVSDSLGNNGTLSISPWAMLSVSSIDLSSTYLDVEGYIAADVGTVNNARLDGSSAYWVSGDTAVSGTLFVSNGATFDGNLLLASGSDVTTDSSSFLYGGTLSASGQATLSILNEPGSGQTETYDLTEALSPTTGSTLSILLSSTTSLDLDNIISGTGVVELSDGLVTLGTLCSLSGSLSLTGNTLVADGANIAGPSEITMDGSQLDLRGQDGAGQSLLNVVCSGGPNTIWAGAGDLDVTGTSGGTLNFIGGSSNATVSAGSATLTFVGGTAYSNVVCGSSGLDSVSLGLGPAYVQGTAGAYISVAGGGSETVVAGGGSETVDGAQGSGNSVYRGGTGGGTTFIYTGSGNDTVSGSTGTLYAVAGSGADEIWAGTSGHDTIVGGAGPDTLFGGTGDTLEATGSSPTLMVTYSSSAGAKLDDSNSSGNDTIWAGGESEGSTISGGSGKNLIVTGAGADSITCGSGPTTVFAASASNDTILSGSGSDLLFGGPTASIRLSGSASDSVISSGGNTLIDASSFTGNDTIFGLGDGVTTVLGGNANQVIVGVTSPLSVLGGSGSLNVWASSNSTIMGGTGNCTLVGGSGSNLMSSGAGTNTLIAQGSGTTLDTTRSTGPSTLFLSSSGETTATLGLAENIVVAGSYAASIYIEGGQDNIWSGSGGLTILFNEAGDVGSVNIHGFDPTVSSLVLPNSNFTESVSHGNTSIAFGSETLTLIGVTGLPNSAITVG